MKVEGFEENLAALSLSLVQLPLCMVCHPTTEGLDGKLMMALGMILFLLEVVNPLDRRTTCLTPMRSRWLLPG